jgi:hypothetical protein
MQFTHAARVAVNSFLLCLVRNPTQCPHLHTLKVAGYPSWELLFETLRRRNAMQVAQMKQVIIQTYPHLVILSKLVKLLQGRTDVFSSRDIDSIIERRAKHQSM